MSGLTLGGKRTWEFVAFGSNTDEEPANVARADFSGATLLGCWFTKADLHAVDFTGCEFIDCDLRFAMISRSRLGQTRFTRCDMYGATLGGGTIVEGMKFALSSPPEFGEGITGLTWECFAGASDAPALVGENEKVYREILRRTEFERPEGADPIEQAIADRLLGAAGGYRRLSGYWTSQAKFADASKAYTYSRRLERTAAKPRRFGGAKFQPITWAGLWIADLVCEFGQNLTRVIAALALVTVLPGVVFAIAGGVTGAHDIWDTLLFSAARMTAATPGGLQPANALVEWIGVAQGFLGIALLGLFGFVLGNTLRQS